MQTRAAVAAGQAHFLGRLALRLALFNQPPRRHSIGDGGKNHKASLNNVIRMDKIPTGLKLLIDRYDVYHLK
jgi:hypothetical protein